MPRSLVAALALLAACAGPPPATPNVTMMTVLYRESPETVVEALADAARAFPLLADVEVAVDGFIAVERPGGNDGVLTVTVEPSGELTAARFTYEYVSQNASAWTHVPSALVREAEEGGLYGAAMDQVRAYTEADSCGTAEGMIPSSPAARRPLGATERPPVLIGGLTGLSARVRYPEVARRAGIAGTAVARFVVDDTGATRCISIVSGLPAGINEEVLRVVAVSRFEPGMRDGEPISVRFTLPVTFWLR